MAHSFNKITVQELYRQHSELLSLKWIAGKKGGRRIVVPELVLPPMNDDGDENSGEGGNGRDRDAMITPDERKRDAGKSLVGYLNLIHPHQVQLLGKVELDFIHNMRDTTLEDTLAQVYSANPVCMIVTDNCPAPEILTRRCKEENVPLLRSAMVSARVYDTLHYFFANLFADMLTMHGVFMEVMGIGVLISGRSGIGKSELALELITRGHRLIADDAPEFAKIAPDIIRGSCPPALADFLEVRGLGVINVRRLYGENAVKKNKYLRLIARLEPMRKEQLVSLDRLAGSYREVRLFGIDVPQITLPVAPGRNMAILVESAVRNHVLRMGGYDSARDFVEHQQSLVDKKASHAG